LAVEINAVADIFLTADIFFTVVAFGAGIDLAAQS
jgi:hypothetical protein